jgi:D-inositol-3-phosphate glycosyltransferase
MTTTPMKIAMVSEHASPLAVIGGVDAGGQNVHVAALAAALASRGHDVTVYTRRDDPDLPGRLPLSPGVTVEHVPAGPARPVAKDEMLGYMPDFGRYLAQAWGRERPDVVHAHFWMSGLAAMVGRRDLDLPVVQTFHALGSVKRRHQGSQDTSPQARIRLESALSRDVDHVIATCSDEVFELVRLGARRGSVSVIPCGVDLEHFTADGPSAPRGTRPRVLTLGRLVQRKGVDTVIRALRRVPHAELVVAGGPEPAALAADPEVRRLAAIAEREMVRDRVSFVGGVTRPDVPALLRSADLVACVPWYEPFGMVPLEAMACGVPVVASAVGGLVDTVVDGTTGALVSPRRADALAVTLRGLLADPVRLEGYGLAGSDRARARYSWQRVATDTEAVYRRVRGVGVDAAERHADVTGQDASASGAGELAGVLR